MNGWAHNIPFWQQSSGKSLSGSAWNNTLSKTILLNAVKWLRYPRKMNWMANLTWPDLTFIQVSKVLCGSSCRLLPRFISHENSLGHGTKLNQTLLLRLFPNLVFILLSLDRIKYSSQRPLKSTVQRSSSFLFSPTFPLITLFCFVLLLLREISIPRGEKCITIASSATRRR